MNLSDIQTQFLSVLNRRDCTPSQITTFINLGVQRISRDLNVPQMEYQLAYTFTGLETPVGTLPLPSDYLGIISLSYTDSSTETKLTRVDLQTALRSAVNLGIPSVFYRRGNYIILGPSPTVGTILYLDYYQMPSALVSPTDTNWLTLTAPDLLLYAALTYAADTFLDERAPIWEGRYKMIHDAIQSNADQDEYANAVMGKAYQTDGDLQWP